MPRVLKQMIGRQRGRARARDGASPTRSARRSPIEDAEGQLLYGDVRRWPSTRAPVTRRDEPWLGDRAAACPDHRLRCSITSSRRRPRRKALGTEVLHLYREINLIYSFSEKLAALLELDRVAAAHPRAGAQLIAATDGAMMLLDEDTGVLDADRRLRRRVPRLTGLRPGDGIVGAVAASGIGEIVNDVDGRPARAVDAHERSEALVVRAAEGGRARHRRHRARQHDRWPYAAAELKLLTTLALQTATAIENARLFERTVQAAAERERLMALHKEAELARAKLEGELEARRADPGGPVSGGAADAGRLRAGGPEPARAPLRRRLLRRAAAAGAHGEQQVAAVRGGRVGQGTAGRTRDEQHAGDAACPDRPDGLARGARRPGERAAAMPPPLRRSTSPPRFVELAPSTGGSRSWARATSTTSSCAPRARLVPLASTGTPLGLLPLGRPVRREHGSPAPGRRPRPLLRRRHGSAERGDEEFGEERLAAALGACAGQPAATMIERTFAAIDEFVGDAPQYDDITMLVVRRLPG